MSKENRFTPEMRKFFERASQLVQQDTQTAVTIEGLVYIITPRAYSAEGKSIVVAFPPTPADNLRLTRKGSYLPTLEVYCQEDQFHGTLEFDRNHVERRHWWSRLDDLLIYSGEHRVQEPLGYSREANNILRSLNRRLEGTPDIISTQ